MLTVLVAPMVALTGAAVLLVPAGGPSAQSGNADLAMSGRVVAGVTGAQIGQHVPFEFVMRNNGPGTAEDIAFTFTIRNGASAEYVCPLAGSGFDINPDTPNCETGALAAGHQTRAAIVAYSRSTGRLTVKACARDLNGATDPTPGNNCAVRTIPIT
jgi:hypothetical protein